MYKPPNYVLHWRHHILEWKYPESYTLHSEKNNKKPQFYSLKIIKKLVLKCKKHVLKCTNHPTMFALKTYFEWKYHQWKNNKKPPFYSLKNHKKTCFNVLSVQTINYVLQRHPYFGMKISWKLHVAQWKNNKKPQFYSYKNCIKNNLF